MTRPDIKTSLPGPKAAELIARDAKAMSPSFTRAYPFVMERGEGCWVTDVDGNRFLDFTAGIAVVTTGHSHPKVVAAIKEQADRFLHMSGTDFYYSSEIELAERLENRILPGTPARVFFTNSGAEAIEGAMKLARYATGRPSYIAFIGAFHGRTFGALSLTASKASQRRRFAPLLSQVFHAPFPTPARGVTTDQTIERIEELFATVAPAESVAAVFVEPIQGEGGYLVPPDDFLPTLRELTSKHGILLGRTLGRRARHRLSCEGHRFRLAAGRVHRAGRADELAAWFARQHVRGQSGRVRSRAGDTGSPRERLDGERGQGRSAATGRLARDRVES